MKSMPQQSYLNKQTRTSKPAASGLAATRNTKFLKWVKKSNVKRENFDSHLFPRCMCSTGWVNNI